MLNLRTRILLLVFCGCLAPFRALSATAADVRFHSEPGEVHIFLDQQRLARYVYRDPEIPRPYFCDVCTPDGIQVTRNHPPGPEDPSDHATFHPGIFLAFGDLSGADSWRLKASVAHSGFLEEPAGEGFRVRNHYLAADGQRILCQEDCRYRFRVTSLGFWIEQDSRFSSATEFAFGDQEEMGLGIRMATALREAGGSGHVLTSEGRQGAKAAWGQAAEWCDYAGTLQQRYVGVTFMAAPTNVRPSWWHVRDYGLCVANLFGREAMGQGPRSSLLVRPAEDFRLQYGILIHSTAEARAYQPQAAYQEYIRRLQP